MRDKSENYDLTNNNDSDTLKTIYTNICVEKNTAGFEFF